MENKTEISNSIDIVNTQNISNIKDKIDNYYIVTPIITDEKVSKLLSKYTKRKVWPKELSEDVLLKNKEIVYIPYLQVSADVHANYNINVGTLYMKQVDCDTCHATGYIEQDKTIKVENGRKIVRCAACKGRGYVQGTIT